MTTWTCPACSRVFGARGRSHICRPGTTIDELAGRSIESFRPIVDAVVAHLELLPHADTELIVDPLDKLVQFKRGPMFAMVRPMTKWTAVSFNLRRRLDTPRISRKVLEQRGIHHHTINVATVDEIDDQLLDWLSESYESYGPDRAASPSAGDPMVPDDVDLW